MQFKSTCTVTQLVKSGQSQNGSWFLYRIEEQISKDKTKSWSVFAKAPLNVGGKYILEGYLSESPNKRFKDDGGKLAYQTTFNVEQATFADDGWPDPRISDDTMPF